MTGYTAEALRQIGELRGHYDQRERIEAIRALDAALYEAERKIAADPAAGIPAPRPYPELARRDRHGSKRADIGCPTGSLRRR